MNGMGNICATMMIVQAILHLNKDITCGVLGLVQFPTTHIFFQFSGNFDIMLQIYVLVKYIRICLTDT